MSAVTIRTKHEAGRSLTARLTATVEFMIRGDKVVHIDVVVTDGVLDAQNYAAIQKALHVDEDPEAAEAARELMAALEGIRS